MKKKMLIKKYFSQSLFNKYRCIATTSKLKEVFTQDLLSRDGNFAGRSEK